MTSLRRRIRSIARSFSPPGKRIIFKTSQAIKARGVFAMRPASYWLGFQGLT